jgi:inorganic pyrophosphatase
MLVTTDQDGEDYKIFAVPVSKVDPRFDEIKSYEDLPAHVQEEYAIYFKEYKRLEKAKYDKITIDGWRGVEETVEHIIGAAKTFVEKHN